MNLKSTTSWGLVFMSAGARATQKAQSEDAPELKNSQALNLQHHFTIDGAECAFNTTARNPADVFSLYHPCGKIKNIVSGPSPQDLPMYSIANSSTVGNNNNRQQKARIYLYTDGKAGDKVNTCLKSKTEADNSILTKKPTFTESLHDLIFSYQFGVVLVLVAAYSRHWNEQTPHSKLKRE